MLALSIFLFSTAAYASEIKIIDDHGLLRAIKIVKENAKVVVESMTPVPEVAMLTNTDGIAGDIPAVVESEKFLVFTGVSEGTWQIKSTPPVSIHAVKISE